MENKTKIGIAVIVIILVQFSPPVSGQIKEGNIEYSAEAKQTCIYLCEPVEIFITLTNVGSVAERINSDVSRSGGTLSVSIIDPDENEIWCKPDSSYMPFGERTLAPTGKVVQRELLIGGRNGYYFNKIGRYKLKIIIYSGGEKAIELSNVSVEVIKPESADLMAFEILDTIWTSYENKYANEYKHSIQAQSEWINLYKRYPMSIYSKYALYAHAIAINASDGTDEAVCNEEIVDLLSGIIAKEDKWQLWPESVMSAAIAYYELGKYENSIVLFDWLNSKREIGVDLTEATANFKNKLLDDSINKMIGTKHQKCTSMSLITILGIIIIAISGAVIFTYIGFKIGKKSKIAVVS